MTAWSVQISVRRMAVSRANGTIRGSNGDFDAALHLVVGGSPRPLVLDDQLFACCQQGMLAKNQLFEPLTPLDCTCQYIQVTPNRGIGYQRREFHAAGAGVHQQLLTILGVHFIGCNLAGYPPGVGRRDVVFGCHAADQRTPDSGWSATLPGCICRAPCPTIGSAKCPACSG